MSTYYSAAFSILDDSIKLIIDDDLNDFLLSSETCCMEFPWIFNKYHRHFIHLKANTINCKSYTHCHRSGKHVKIYKSFCKKYSDEIETFNLTDSSRTEAIKFLQTARNKIDSNFRITYNNEISKNLKQQQIPLYRLCLLTSSNATVTNTKLTKPKKSLTSSSFEYERSLMPIYKYRSIILETIKINRISIMVSDSGYGKSTQIPQFILDDAYKKDKQCRIISIQTNKLSVLNLSEKIALQRGEQIGITVGFQIRLESVSSHSTNLLFTTTKYFLRCLIGYHSSNDDIFSCITHIIIDDFNERDVYSDLLLLEIKEILKNFPHLKIIINITNSKSNLQQKIKEYMMNEAFILELESDHHENEVLTYYLDDIPYVEEYIYNKKIQEQHQTDENNTEINLKMVNFIDNIIERLTKYGNDEDFRFFIYLVEGEGSISINVQQTKSKISVLMAAVLHKNIKYVRKLVGLGIDIHLTDAENRSALDWARLTFSTQCEEYLIDINEKRLISENSPSSSLQQIKNFTDECTMPSLSSSSPSYFLNDNNFNNVNHNLIFILLKYLHESNIDNNYSILIFLPKFDDLLRQKYILMKNTMEKNINNIEIHLLHDNIEKNELNSILSTSPTLPEMNNLSSIRKIILCTDIAETSINIHNVIAVIDTGLLWIINNSNDNKNILQWITKEKAERRALIAKRHQLPIKGYCYRLYTKKNYNDIMPITITKLQYLNNNINHFEKICIYMKLLSTFKTIKEYFTHMIEIPSQEIIEEKIKLLKIIGLLDEYENVTLLGGRLIDIPIDLKLAKALIISVALQCLDPILTIVSALKYEIFPVFIDNLNSNEIIEMLSKEKVNSDHLILLRIFQKWQNEKTLNITQYEISDLNTFNESTFVLNGILEFIYYTRSKLVGSLRAIDLVTSTGSKNMNIINSYSNIWPLIKCSLIVGLYPNIGRIDNDFYCTIKSVNDEYKCIHKTSIIRQNLQLNKFEKKKYDKSNWVTYHSDCEIKNNYKNIICNTIITPISIALFCGNLELSKNDIINSEFDYDNEYNEINFVQYTIDKWITFKLNKNDAYLIYNLREKFFNYFLKMIRTHNENINYVNTKNKKQGTQLLKINNCNSNNKNELLDVISKIILYEDQSYNFIQPDKVGEKPKALSIKLKSDLNRIKEELCNLPILQLQQNNTNSNQNNHIPSCNNNNKKFHILKFSIYNEWNFQRGFIDQFNVSETSIWNFILNQYQNKSNIEIFVFLLHSEVNVFYGIGKIYVMENKKWYFEIVSKGNVSLQVLQSLYSTNYMACNQLNDGDEIPVGVAEMLMKYF